MKKHIFKLSIALFALLLGVFAVAGTASAQGAGPLSVDFNPEPLFNGSSLMPGDGADANFTATNNTDDAQEIFVIFNKTGGGDLGEVISISVENAAKSISETKTLADWFAEGQFSLGTLADEESAVYELDAQFDPTAGNEYQGSTVVFDVCVGLTSGDIQCADDVSGDTDDDGGDGGSGGGGGGGGGGDDEDDEEGGDDDGIGGSPDDGIGGGDIDDDSDGIVAGANTVANASTGSGGNDNNNGIVAGASIFQTEEGGNDIPPDEEQENMHIASALLALGDWTGNGYLEGLGIFLIALFFIWLAMLLFDWLRDASGLSEYSRRVYRWMFISAALVVFALMAFLVSYERLAILFSIATILGFARLVYLHKTIIRI